jgi:hypothetical protein
VRLVVTPEQFSRLWKLSDACSRYNYFDEEQWVAGVRQIVGPIEDGTYEVVVNWRSTRTA